MSGIGHRGRNALEHILEQLFQTASSIFASEQAAAGTSLIHGLDPRVKVIAAFALILSVTAVGRLPVLTALFTLSVAGVIACRLPFGVLVSRVWAGAFLFTGCLAIPALFLTPGTPVLLLPSLQWTITKQGLSTAAFLILRVETTATIAYTLVATTRWMFVLKALRGLRVPAPLVVVLSMTVRYIVLLLDTAHQMFEAQRSRTVGRLGARDQRRLISGTAGVLLGKSMQLSQEVYLAMLSRGFRGEVYLLDDFAMSAKDRLALSAFLALAAAAWWAGR